MDYNSTYLSEFLTKNQANLAKTVNPLNIHTEILQNNEAGLLLAGSLIQKGKLVAFPTETVYGLGANALDEEAVYSIFKAKNRPLTDPVIIHVSSAEEALKLVEISAKIEKLFLFLSKVFWPGPLTIIMKAAKCIPSCVTAHTGFVGIRCPSHEVAQTLIKEANRPIAAPSANTFSHVSPTSAIHVFNDLYDKDISIIDGGNSKFGIESTVIKLLEGSIEGAPLKISVLRNGSVSEKAINDCLRDSEEYKTVEVAQMKKEKTVEIEENSEAPGQLLKHYSPLCETFLLENSDKPVNLPENGDEKWILGCLKESVLIDFANTFNFLKEDVLGYFCLSETGDLLEAMNKLYEALRWGENVQNVKYILITNIDVLVNETMKMPEFVETVYDKTYRSSSGKKIVYHNKCLFLKQ